MNFSHAVAHKLRKILIGAASLIFLSPLFAPLAMAAEQRDTKRFVQTPAIGNVSLTLAQIGEQGGIRLNGANAVKVLYLPENYSLKASSLQLHLRFSPAMPSGKLWIESDNRIIADESIPKTETSVWSVPLSGVKPINGVVPLAIHMVVDNPNLCRAMAGNWLYVEPGSVLSFTERPHASVPLIDQFFPIYLKTVDVILPQFMNEQSAQAVLDIAAFLTHRYAVTPKIVLLRKREMPKDPVFSRTVIFGGDKLGVVQLNAGKNRHFLALQLGPNPAKATQAIFVHSRVLPAMAVNSASNLETTLRNVSDVSGSRVTFAKLGYPSEQVQGFGALNVTYRFSQADLGGSVRGLSLRFAGIHSPLPKNANGFISVKFNGIAIYAQPLENTRYDFYIQVPAGLIKRNNTVILSFEYAPGGGNCTQGSLPFMGTVDNASYLQFHRGESLPPGFDRFPVVFAKAMPVLLQELSQASLSQAVALVSAMQETTRTQLHPMVVQSLPKSGPLLFIGNFAPKDAFLQINPFALRDSHGKTLLKYSPGSNFSALETYGTTLALVGPPGLRATLLTQSLQRDGWYGLHGDTVVQGVSGHPVDARMVGKGLEIQPLPTHPGVFLSEYRYWFIALFGLIIVALLVWLYPRLVRKGGPSGS